jgi:hypothetical protein
VSPRVPFQALARWLCFAESASCPPAAEVPLKLNRSWLKVRGEKIGSHPNRIAVKCFMGARVNRRRAHIIAGR